MDMPNLVFLHGMSVYEKFSRYRPGVAQRVGRVIALLFHDHSTRRGVSGQQHALAALYPWEDPVPILSLYESSHKIFICTLKL
jgi:hypothetical protein